MKKRRIPLQEIIEFLGSDLLDVFGVIKDIYIDNLADVDNINETTLDWININIKNKQSVVENSRANVVLTDKSIEYNEILQVQGKVLLIVDNPKFAVAAIGNYFFVENFPPTISSKAEVHPNAKIGRNVSIGPNSVIGECEVGDDTFIDSNVRIHDGVLIGSQCTIKSGAVLGGTGFGFERDKNGNLIRFPQIGGLIIGNSVEIGANTCIDRGALSDTIIGDFTKVNNLCHIAHNNKIGKNVIITGCVNISGSNHIDDNVWIAPNSSIRGFLKIGQGVTIGMGAVVTKNIPDNETWMGNPAKKRMK